VWVFLSVDLGPVADIKSWSLAQLGRMFRMDQTRTAERISEVRQEVEEKWEGQVWDGWEMLENNIWELEENRWIYL
jgi:hypothetical protein